MNEFLKMDVFFVVTTLAVIVLTVFATLIFIRVLRILKNIEGISLMVEEEGQKLRADIDEVRVRIREEGLRAKHLFDFLSFGKPKARRPKKESKES